jgi:uncharacterized protein DUF4307
MTDEQSFPIGGRRRSETNQRRQPRMSTLLQDRYGRAAAPGRRRLLLALGAVALAVSLAFIGWVTLFHAPTLHWDDIGFHVRSDAEIDVTFDVGFTGSSGSDRPSAVCTVQALNALRTEVGLQDVRVQAGPGGRIRTTLTLQTSERAATGLVKSCSRVN